jgi:phosphotransferase system IIB component
MARTKGSKNKVTTNTVDWETLAKRLQQALASEIKESDDLKKELEATQAVLKKSAARHAILNMQNRYLENTLADYMARNDDGNDPV